MRAPVCWFEYDYGLLVRVAMRDATTGRRDFQLRLVTPRLAKGATTTHINLMHVYETAPSRVVVAVVSMTNYCYFNSTHVGCCRARRATSIEIE